MFGLGFGEVLIILLFALIFIGPKKLPELARGMGKAISEFQNATQKFKAEMNNVDVASHEAQTPAQNVSEKTDDEPKQTLS